MGQRLKFWRWPLANQILFGLVFGILLGLATGAWVDSEAGQARLDLWVAQLIQPLGRLFIRIIFMIVVPLIFSAIVLGVAEMGDVRKLGRVGLRSLWFTLLLSGTSVFVGITFVDVLKPGVHMAEETRHELLVRYGADAGLHTVHLSRPETPPLADTLLNLIPQNPLAEAVNAFAPNYTGGGLMSVMVFSLFFGVALALVPREKASGLFSVLQGTFEVCMRVINFAMRLAPMGVTCLGFVVAETLGLDMIKSLGFYMGVVLAALAFQQFVVYSVFLKLGCGYSPWLFFSRIKEVMLTAFSTSSSNATLPVSLRVGEENLKLPSRISRFVLTVGASANQNGTALYEGVTVLFLAQVFGVDLTVPQQIVVTLMCIMTGLGTAGVPGGSLPLVVGVLVSLGIPGESIAIILGIDRLLDMCRSCLNVTGDLVCAVLVSRNEPATAEEEVELLGGAATIEAAAASSSE